jgi:hypothetical protein
MPKYIFTYHQPEGYVPGTDGDAMAAWQSFFDGIASHIADTGQPVSERRALGKVGAGTQLGGYSVVDAADLDTAVRLANGCPSLERGGGVQVGALAEVPGLAERVRERAAQR